MVIRVFIICLLQYIYPQLIIINITTEKLKTFSLDLITKMINEQRINMQMLKQQQLQKHLREDQVIW